MSAPFDFGQIYEQEFDASGHYLRLLPTGRQLVLDLDKFAVTHVRGKTRSGKTSLTLTPFIYHLAKDAGPVFIFDLSPEPANLHHAHAAARAAGKKFKFLCLEPNAKSYLFPPFQALSTAERRNAVHLAQLLVTAFNADHGIVNQYFSMQGCAALLDAAIDFSGTSCDPSAKALLEFLIEPESRKRYPHAEEIRMPVQFLAELDQLASGDSELEILIDKAIEEGHVIYFYTSNLSGPLTARLAAGLGLYTVVHFARQRTDSGNKPRIRIITDEFQSLVGKSLSALLTESCKYGIRYILANQSTSQLQTRELDLAQIVFENSDLKIYFSCFGDDDTVALQSLSKRNRVVKSKSTCYSRILESSETESEMLAPYINDDAIKDASAIFGMCIVVVSDGSGHREPVFVHMKHLYENLQHKSLPLRPRTATEPTADPGPGRRIPLDDPDRQARHTLIRQLLAGCEAQERWN